MTSNKKSWNTHQERLKKWKERRNLALGNSKRKTKIAKRAKKVQRSEKSLDPIKPHWSRPTGRRLNLLDLPKGVLDQVLRELFPPDDVNIFDRSASFRTHDQTTYSLPGQTGRTTYTVREPDISAAALLRRHFHPLFCASFLRVSRKCYALGIATLYNRSFHFSQSIQSCQAFLHDHHRAEHRIPHIHLSPDLSDLIPRIWRILFNKLVHERPDLQSLHIHLPADFWTLAPWQPRLVSAAYAERAERTIKELLANHKSKLLLAETQSKPKLVEARAVQLYSVLHWYGPNDDAIDEDKLGILYQVARVPKRIEISIGGSEESDERKIFSRALMAYLRRLSQQRPRLDEGRGGSCSVKKLEKCCYGSMIHGCGRMG